MTNIACNHILQPDIFHNNFPLLVYPSTWITIPWKMLDLRVRPPSVNWSYSFCFFAAMYPPYEIRKLFIEILQSIWKWNFKVPCNSKFYERKTSNLRFRHYIRQLGIVYNGISWLNLSKEPLSTPAFFTLVTLEKNQQGCVHWITMKKIKKQQY